MKFLAAILAACLAAAPTLLHASDAPQQPVAWGMLTNNSSCVIFAEGHKTKGHFYGVAVTTKTVGKLTPIETVNYTFDQKQVLETQENMDALMQAAQKDRVKYVKIPEKYSPDLLQQARDLCKANAAQ